MQQERTYKAVIGLEFHVHLATTTKMFCGCRVTYGEPPNTHTCPVCLGHPGALPVTNEKAVELGVMAGLALNCDVADRAVFARKNYFYPDLPKGYQISQFDEPICTGGHIDVPTPEGRIRVGITRLHLEEDAAKNVHVGTSGRMHGSVGSLVDFNRGGTPLMEIVTEPDIPSPEAASATANQLKDILRAVGVSEADMEKGQLRCDANVSIRNPDGTFGTKTELKNMNSFRFVERGLARELERQREILKSGGRVSSRPRSTTTPRPTRCTSSAARSTPTTTDTSPSPTSCRSSSRPAYVREIEERLPELPDQMLARFVEQYGLSEYDAGVLTSDRELASFYEAVAAEADPKQASNWISGDLRALLNETGTDISDSRVTPEHMKELIELVAAGKVSRSAARTALDTVFETGDSPSVVVEREGLASVGSDELSGVVDEVDLRQPRRGRAGAGRGQEGRGFPHRPDHEGHPRQRRRREGPRAPDGEAGLLEVRGPERPAYRRPFPRTLWPP